MTGLWLLFPAVLLLAGLLYFEKQENRKGMVPVKGGLSALFVARDRFVNTGIRNRYAGLPRYYAGQFLLAYSTAMPEGF